MIPRSARALRRGRSFLQGPHHVAQKCNRYGLPSTSGGSPPIQPFAGSAGAGLPTMAAIGSDSPLTSSSPSSRLLYSTLASSRISSSLWPRGSRSRSNDEPLILNLVAFLGHQLGEPIGQVQVRLDFVDAQFRTDDLVLVLLRLGPVRECGGIPRNGIQTPGDTSR